jgi:DNA-binding transcriptional LysR family regulator
LKRFAMQLLDAIADSTRSSQSLTRSQMAAFLAVANCGSFSQAAEQLALSQPALSQRIKQMESALGTALFDRSHRKVVLSGKGTLLLPLAARVVRACADAQNGMTQWKKNSAPQINIVGSAAIMPVVTFGLLQRLQQEFGSAAMRVSEALSSDIRQQVLDGQAALGVCVDMDMHPKLRYTPVLEVQLGLLASPLCKLPKVIDTLDALEGVPMVRCSDRAVNTQLLRKHCPGFRAYFDAPVVVDDVQAATELVRRGAMVTVGTGVGASHIKADGLVFIPLPDLLPIVHIYIVSHRDAVFDARQERLREVLHQSIHDAPWHESVRRVGRPHLSQPLAKADASVGAGA